MKKFLIIERFLPGKAKALYERVELMGRQLPEGLVYIDSWIDEDVEVCYQLMECKSPGLVRQWVKLWEDLADFEIVPVLSSSEAKNKVLNS